MSIHDSYPEQRKGKVSKYWIIRFLDLLFMRMDYKKNEYISTNVLVWFWTLQWFVTIPFKAYIPEWICDACHYSIFISALYLPLIYRHFRHKYLKKHNLPGPFGWGTIDAMTSGCYWTEEIFTL